MKKHLKICTVIIAALGLLMLLAGCGELAMEVSDDGRGAEIIADSTDDGDLVTAGSLQIGEGDILTAEYAVDEGAVNIKLVPVIEGEEDMDSDELEEAMGSGDPALDETLSGQGTTEYAVAPGEYYVSAVMKGKTSASVALTVKKEDQAKEEPAEKKKSAEENADGQNPVMNFVGPYVCDRAKIMIEARGKNKAKVVVTWGSSASEMTKWTMSGPFDEETRAIEYHNCVRKDLTYNEDGTVKSKEKVYVGGHGFLTFAEDGTLTWQEDQEHAADGMTFEFNADAK